VVTNLIKLANELDSNKNFEHADSVLAYLIDLVQSKDSLLKSDTPVKLLMLEKAGVDTSNFFNKMKNSKLSKEDVESIDKQFTINCPDKKIDKNKMDLKDYISIMDKNDEISKETNDNKEKYLDNLRETFIEFLTDVVVKDFRNENIEMNSDNLIQYYFKNREKYEDQLSNYDLMLGQTEGIMSDDEFEDELDDELQIDEAGPIVRHGE